MSDSSTSGPQWPGSNPDAGPPAWEAPPTAWEPAASSSRQAPPGWQPPAPPPGSPPGTPPGSPSGYRPPPTPTGAPLGHAPTFRSWQPGIIPLRPLSFGDFLTVPFRAMRFNRGVIVGAPLLMSTVATLLTMTTLWVLFNDPLLGLMSPQPTLSAIGVPTIVLIVITIAGWLLADLLSSAIIAPGVARAILGERIGFGVAWGYVRGRLGSLIALYLVGTTVLLVVMGVAALPLIGGLVAGDDSAVGAGALVTLLLMLAVAPLTVVVGLFQGIARAMIVLEKIGFAAALGRLFRLIKGRFWWSVLIMFVAAVLINVASSILQYVGQFGAFAVILVAPENVMAMVIALFVVYGLAYIVSLVAIYAYLGSVFALLYIDLRMRHEGFDLDLARAAEARAVH